MKNIQENAYDNSLAQTLISLEKRDFEAMTFANTQKQNNPDFDAKNYVHHIETENAEALKNILAQTGQWPSLSHVGQEASIAAFVIAQHADHDPAFQRQCLSLLEKSALEGEAHPAAVAFLTDRILVNEKQTQLYGTQLHPNAQGMFELQPTDDMTHINEQRQAIGLRETLEDYITRMNHGDDTPFRDLYQPYTSSQTPVPQFSPASHTGWANYVGQRTESSAPALPFRR